MAFGLAVPNIDPVVTTVDDARSPMHSQRPTVPVPKQDRPRSETRMRSTLEDRLVQNQILVSELLARVRRLEHASYALFVIAMISLAVLCAIAWRR